MASNGENGTGEVETALGISPADKHRHSYKHTESTRGNRRWLEDTGGSDVRLPGVEKIGRRWHSGALARPRR